MNSGTRHRKSIRDRIILGLLVVCGALLFNGIRHSGAQQAGVAPTTSRATLTGFSLPDLNGKAWSLRDHRGKVVLLNFWATWCPPCNEETPGLVRLANNYSSQGLDVIGVNMDGGDSSPVKRFVAEYLVPYPVLLASSNTSLPLRVEGLPTTVLLDRQGRIAKTYEGAVSEAAFQSDVVRLLGER